MKKQLTKKWIVILFVLIPQFLLSQNSDEWLQFPEKFLKETNTEHFNLYIYNDYIDKQMLENMLIKRENAWNDITNFFGHDPKIKINIFLFPDETTKYEITGHNGFGWGFENNIVEIFNDSIQLDSYHELVHVLGYTFSKPPAVIDEGLAVYLSQTFGEYSFIKMLGFSDEQVNKTLKKAGSKKLIPFSDFIYYREINEAENPALAYCQAASFVGFLISEFGKSKFLKLYRSFKQPVVEIPTAFYPVYGCDVNQLEKKWLKNLNKTNVNPSE